MTELRASGQLDRIINALRTYAEGNWFEAGELSGEGLEKVHNPNIGGTVTLPWGSAKLVPAWHTSTTPKGTANVPAGAIVQMGGTTVYHLGDTGLFGDLELIGRRHAIDVALIPIGGHFTMDRHAAVEASGMRWAASWCSRRRA